VSDTLALEKLYNDVVAQFVADAAAETPAGTPPHQSFGWREPAKRGDATTQAPQMRRRIAWVPGDDASGDLGASAPARNPGRNPRPLATLAELVTVYIEAADLTAAENELAQYRAARFLYDAWLRAVYIAARGTFQIRSQRWVDDRATRRFGATIRVVLALEAMVPDAPLETAPVDTDALVTTHLEPNDDEGETDAVSAG
jgi:hypothetical protein